MRFYLWLIYSIKIFSLMNTRRLFPTAAVFMKQKQGGCGKQPPCTYNFTTTRPAISPFKILAILSLNPSNPTSSTNPSG